MVEYTIMGPEAIQVGIVHLENCSSNHSTSVSIESALPSLLRDAPALQYNSRVFKISRMNSA